MNEESIPSTSQRLFMHNLGLCIHNRDMGDVVEEPIEINDHQFIDPDEAADEAAGEAPDDELNKTSTNAAAEVKSAVKIKRSLKRLSVGQLEFLRYIEQYPIIWDPNMRATEAQKKEFWQRVTRRFKFKQHDTAQRKLKDISKKIGFEINDKIFECIRNENINPVQLAKPAPRASRVKSDSRARSASRASGSTSFSAPPTSRASPAPRAVPTTSQQTPQQSSVTTDRVLDEWTKTQFKMFMHTVRFKFDLAMRHQFENFIREHDQQNMDIL